MCSETLHPGRREPRRLGRATSHRTGRSNPRRSRSSGTASRPAPPVGFSVDREPPTIRITEGPYVVEGTVPLVRTAHVETDHGEPVAWAPDEAIDRYAKRSNSAGAVVRPTSRSATVPTGGGTASTAPRPPIGDPARHRRKSYAGVDMVLTDDRTLCEHAGFCGDRYTNAWRMTRETDDPAVREQLISMVKLCPSGALEYSLEEGGDPIEPELPTGVAVVRDGPLWLRGGVRVVGADGVEYETRNRVDALSVRAVGEQALLRRHPPGDRVHRPPGVTVSFVRTRRAAVPVRVGRPPAARGSTADDRSPRSSAGGSPRRARTPAPRGSRSRSAG